MATLKDVAIDPLSSYINTLERIKGVSQLPDDPTNPFTLLLEEVSTNIAYSSESFFLFEKRHFPILASNKDELFRHISDADTENLFASPSKGKFRFFANLRNVLDYAVKDADTYSFQIPKYSTITIDGIIFTLTSNVNCTISERNGNFYPFIENEVDGSTILNRNIGNAKSGIIQDAEGVEYVVFELTLSQVKVGYYKADTTRGVVFDVSIPFDNSYYSSILEYTSNGGLVPLNKIYVESLFDIDVPSAYVSVGDSSLDISIPQIFLDNGSITGTIGMYVFTTNGSINIDLSKYKTDDFTLSLNANTDLPEAIAATSIAMNVVSTDIVIGGTNVPDFREMKKKVIKRTTGAIDLPITEYQLEESSKLLGYKLAKSSDTLLGRSYIATRNIEPQTLIGASPTVFSSATDIKVETGTDIQDTVLISDKYLTIKPGTLFKRSGDIFVPISKAESDSINLMSSLEAVSYMEANLIMFNPFYYIMANQEAEISSRIYDVNNPTLDFIEIYNKNKSTDINVNVTGYSVFKRDGGNSYDLFFIVLGNSEYDAVSGSVELAFMITNTTGSFITIKADRDLANTVQYFPSATDAFLHVRVELSDFIDVGDTINVINGTSPTTIRNTALSNSCKIVLYTNDNAIISSASPDALLYLNDYEKEIPTSLGLTRETIDFTPIVPLEYLWNRATSFYTERTFKRYTVDIPLRYTEDVYDTDPITNCDVTVFDDDGDGICDRYEITLLHAKGDIVLDANLDTVYLHRVGDVLLDENNEPVVDDVLGIERILEILLLEYKYKYVNTDFYKVVLDDINSYLRKIVIDDMGELNSTTLDNTKISFKPIKSVTPVALIDGTEIEPIVRPTVILYVDKESTTTLPSNEDLVSDIGVIISKYINKVFIELQKAEDEIKLLYRDVALIEIKGITKDDRRYISLKDNSNRPTIATKIDESFKAVYDITVDVRYK